MTKKRGGFWGRFDDLMEGLPDYIDSQIEVGDNSVNSIGNNNTVVQSSHSGKSITISNGIKVVTETKNGKSKITINGEEVVPKKYADELYNALDINKPIESSPIKMKVALGALNNYKKYLEKRK